MESLLEAVLLQTSRKVLNHILPSLISKDSPLSTFSNQLSVSSPGLQYLPILNFQACPAYVATPSAVAPNIASYQVPVQSPTLEVSSPCPSVPINENNVQQTEDNHAALRKGCTNDFIDLYSWCPVDLEEDGDCRVAGIVSRTFERLCHQLEITDIVSSVSENGQFIKTKNGQKYKLHGTISWSTYCLLNPETAVEHLPSDMMTAFGSGFPKYNWRSWTQGLYYFACNTQDAYSVFSGKWDDARNLKTLRKHSSLRANNQLTSNPKPADDCSASELCNVDLDEEDTSSSSSPSDSPRTLNQSTSSSHFTSVSTSAKKRKRSIRYCVTPRLLRRGKYESSKKFSTKSNKSSLVAPSEPLPTKYQASPKLPTLRSDRHGNHDVDKRFRLYTDSGRVLDARRLEKTRSGRWIIPKLDSQYEQSIIVDHDRIAGVNCSLRS